MSDLGYCLELQKAMLEQDIQKIREQFKDSINLMRIEFEQSMDKLTKDLGDRIIALGREE
jgi:DNA anti-recombination protein RmuC